MMKSYAPFILTANVGFALVVPLEPLFTLGSLYAQQPAFSCQQRIDASQQQASPPQAAEAPQWQPLFDGKTLNDWKITNFGGEGDVSVKDGAIIMDYGSPLTGVTYTGEFPRTNYEVRLEAMRLDGIDFFAGTTFPVADSHCSFVVAGWAGGVVGLSSIDGKDASENETTRYMSFENDRWYRLRVRVTPQKIQAWIDGEQVVDQNIAGRRISTRNEVDLSKPFGISAYETRAAIRNIQVRRVKE